MSDNFKVVCYNINDDGQIECYLNLRNTSILPKLNTSWFSIVSSSCEHLTHRRVLMIP